MDDSGDSIDHDFFSSGDETEKNRSSKVLNNDRHNTYKSSVKVRIPSADGDNLEGNKTPTDDLNENTSSDSSTSSSSVTDVSPLSSPNRTPRVKNRKTLTGTTSSNHNNIRNKTSSLKKKYYSSSSESEHDFVHDEEKNEVKKINKKRQQKEMLRQRNDIASYNHRRRLLDVAAQNSMDLSQLLEVILTMNEGKAQNMQDPFGPSIGPPQGKNRSFTNQQAYEIDRENQRLLRELARVNKKERPSSAASTRSSMSVSSRSSMRPTSSVSGYRPATSQSRLYHAGRNRILSQQRIEKENLAMLKRLQSAKSDKSIRRNKLLEEYKKQSNYMSNSMSRTSNGTRTNKTYQRHLQRHGFSPSKPEWQN